MFSLTQIQLHCKTSRWLSSKNFESKFVLFFQQLRYNFHESPANGPITTLPAPLDSPIRKPNQSAISHYISVGKVYIQFYKIGIKNIYYNYKASRRIQNLINSKYGGAVSQAIEAGAISRSDFQLLTRNLHDLKRVPLFCLMLAIFGEFTPLIAIFLGSIVPLTCRIPAQITYEQRRLEEVRRRVFQEIDVEPLNVGNIKSQESKHLRQISRSLGLNSQILHYIGGPPTIILRHKVKKRLEYLRIDDKLIEMAGGVKKMDVREVKMALVKRGVDVTGRDESELRCILTSWLSSRSQVSYERLFLTRPSNWPITVKSCIKSPAPTQK